MKLLIPVSEPKLNDSYALYCAAAHGHTECVKLLIAVSDATANCSMALRAAAAEGHVECLKLLIPVSSPLIEIEGILLDALDAGEPAILSAMLACEPRILGKVDLAPAIRDAIANGQPEFAAFLSSIAEQKSIAECLGLSGACSRAIPQRL